MEYLITIKILDLSNMVVAIEPLKYNQNWDML